MTETLTPSSFEWVRDLVRRESAIVLEPGKEYLVEARLLPLARAAGTKDVGSYVEALRRAPDATSCEKVVEALTTNETSWFRDATPWRALMDSIVPGVLASPRPDRVLRVWSAACSSGQEPYSVVMAIGDQVRDAGWRLEVVATDISEEMVRRTERGVYSQLEMNRGLPVANLVRHFQRVGREYQVADEVRSVVKVSRMNLAAPFPYLPTFDIVLLRNVLIYFDASTKRSILERVSKVLRPDGHLLLGGAETTLGIDDRWERQVVSGAPVHRPVQATGRKAV